MYAIIRTGGKQYKVQAGDLLRIEKIEKDLGDEFEVTDVLCVGGDKTYVGSPTLAGAKVTAIVTNQSKAPKVLVFKKKRRQGYRRMQGHRQLYTEVFIKSITTPDGDEVKAKGQVKVFDPAKKAERSKKVDKTAQTKVGKKKTATKRKAVKKKTAKKKVAKKTAKKTGAKKATAKKKTAKKKTKKKA